MNWNPIGSQKAICFFYAWFNLPAATESPFFHRSLIVLTRKSGQISRDLSRATLYLPNDCSSLTSSASVQYFSHLCFPASCSLQAMTITCTSHSTTIRQKSFTENDCAIFVKIGSASKFQSGTDYLCVEVVPDMRYKHWIQKLPWWSWRWYNRSQQCLGTQTEPPEYNRMGEYPCTGSFFGWHLFHPQRTKSHSDTWSGHWTALRTANIKKGGKK